MAGRVLLAQRLRYPMPESGPPTPLTLNGTWSSQPLEAEHSESPNCDPHPSLCRRMGCQHCLGVCQHLVQCLQ